MPGPIKERLDQYELTLTREDDSTGKREFIIDWADRVFWYKYFVGGWITSLVYWYPKVHPTFVGLVVEKCQIRAYGNDVISTDASQELTDIQPEHGIITVLYKARKVSDNSSSSSSLPNLAVVDQDYSVQVLAVPGQDWYWVGGHKNGKKVNDTDETPQLLYVTKQIVLQLGERQTVDKAAMEDALGKVNEFEYLTHAPGTLLFLGAKTRQVLTAQGFERPDIELRMMHNKNGWNKFWDGKAFSEISRIAGGGSLTNPAGPPYTAVNFDGIVITDATL